MEVRAVMDRIMERLEIDERGCWLWTGPLRKEGYVNLTVGLIADGTRRKAWVHRLTYEYFRGPIPDGLELDHLCRVRHCVNPWHVEAVTHRENVLRGTSPSAGHARKTHCVHGHSLADAYAWGARRHRRCRTCHRERQVRRTKSVVRDEAA